jgi:hypothetical protein
MRKSAGAMLLHGARGEKDRHDGGELRNFMAGLRFWT